MSKNNQQYSKIIQDSYTPPRSSAIEQKSFVPPKASVSQNQSSNIVVKPNSNQNSNIKK